MVTKELIASVYHLHSFLSSSSYVGNFRNCVSIFEASNKNINPNYSQTIDNLRTLQSRVIDYEQKTSFPFDGNPYLKMLGIEPYMGIGSIQRLIELLDLNPGEADKLLSAAVSKLQNAQNITNSLNESLKPLPLYGDAATFYKPSDDYVIARFIMPAKENSTLDNSVKDMDALQSALENIGKLNKGQGAYSFKVVAISQSSPESVLVMILVQSAFVLNTIAKTLLKRWGEVEGIRNIRAQTEKLAAETDHIKASKDKILKELESMEKPSNSDDKKLAKFIVDEFGGEIDGARNEVEKSVVESIKYVENLIINGGRVNIYLEPGQIQQKNSEGWKEELIENRESQLISDTPQRLIDKQASEQNEDN